MSALGRKRTQRLAKEKSPGSNPGVLQFDDARGGILVSANPSARSPRTHFRTPADPAGSIEVGVPFYNAVGARWTILDAQWQESSNPCLKATRQGERRRNNDTLTILPGRCQGQEGAAPWGHKGGARPAAVVCSARKNHNRPSPAASEPASGTGPASKPILAGTNGSSPRARS